MGGFCDMWAFSPTFLSPVAIHTEHLEIVLGVAVESQPSDDIDCLGVSFPMLFALAVDVVEGEEVYLILTTTGTLTPLLSNCRYLGPPMDLVPTHTRAITERTSSG